MNAPDIAASADNKAPTTLTSSYRFRGHDRPEDERFSLTQNFLYGLQHVLTMAAGLLAVPIIVGQAAGLSTGGIAALITASFFMGGLATLLQTLGVIKIGSQLPLVQGVSFAVVATMVTIVKGPGGLPAAFGAVIVAGMVGFLIVPLFSKLIRFFPPVVTGSVITTIGLTLMPVAASWSMGGNRAAPDYGSVSNIALAGVTLLISLLLSKAGSGLISRLSFLISIVIGTLLAWVFGMADFSGLANAALFTVPQFLPHGMPSFHLAAIVSMVIVILVTLTETSADMLAIGEIVGTKVDSKRLADGLRADMLSSTVSPFFGSFTQSAFAQNVGLIAVTNIKSRFVVAAAGVILVVLGLLPFLGMFVAMIPPMVLGGAGVILFSTVASSGIRTLSVVKYENNMNLIIVGVSIGMGLLPVVMPGFYDHFPNWFQTIFSSGISSSAITAVLLNLLFNHLRLGNPQDPSVFSEAVNRRLDPHVIEMLQEGDHYTEGKVFDATGKEVPLDVPQ